MAHRSDRALGAMWLSLDIHISRIGAPQGPSDLCVTCLVRRGASMKPRHPKLDWIKTVLAGLEEHRGDPQVTALADELAGTASEPAPAPASQLDRNSRAPIRP
jgi:hypothetical protein